MTQHSAPSTQHSLRRIVLTGGPGSGKTVISQRIAEADRARFVLVPEAATQVYTAMQTRWDRLDLPGRRDVQRRIYHTQIEQESRLAREHPGKTLLLDRGTIDGASYWPDGPADYWRDLGSTIDAELSRYDAVIWLETSATLGENMYDGDTSNACRFEDAAAAIAAGQRLLDLWKGHPNLKHVGSFAILEEKIEAVKELIDLLKAT